MEAGSASSISVLDSKGFDELLVKDNPFEYGRCTLDLSDVRLVTPAGQVQLAAVCEALAGEGREPTIIVRDSAVRSYLIRAGFVTVVGEVAHFDPPIPRTEIHLYTRRAGL